MAHVRKRLLTCRAPLRNRTVDLLLTIGTIYCPDPSTCTNSTAGRTECPDCTQETTRGFHDRFHGPSRQSRACYEVEHLSAICGNRAATRSASDWNKPCHGPVTAWRESSTTPFASSLADSGPVSEIPQAALETLHEVRGDRRLAFGLTTGRFTARFRGFLDAKHGIQQLVGIR
jgi:hypothetical protein